MVTPCAQDSVEAHWQVKNRLSSSRSNIATVCRLCLFSGVVGAGSRRQAQICVNPDMGTSHLVSIPGDLRSAAGSTIGIGRPNMGPLRQSVQFLRTAQVTDNPCASRPFGIAPSRSARRANGAQTHPGVIRAKVVRSEIPARTSPAGKPVQDRAVGSNMVSARQRNPNRFCDPLSLRRSRPAWVIFALFQRIHSATHKFSRCSGRERLLSFAAVATSR